MGVPWIWVSDTVRHFKNRALQLVAESVGTSHRFAVANSAWTSATVEHMMRELFNSMHSQGAAERKTMPASRLGANRARGTMCVQRRLPSAVSGVPVLS